MTAKKAAILPLFRLQAIYEKPFIPEAYQDCAHLGLSKGTPSESARTLGRRSPHAGDPVVYTTDTNGLHSFRDRALFNINFGLGLDVRS